VKNVALAGVGVIIRDAHDRLLLQRRAGTHGGGTWSCPGGHIDYGETPEQCAVRETLEEVGIMVGNVRFLGITNDVFAETQRHYITVWVQADHVSGTPRPMDPEELTEIGWFAQDSLPSPLFLPLQQLLAGKAYQTDSSVAARQPVAA
jgi:8-oxo-dGTP diphosphatase